MSNNEGERRAFPTKLIGALVLVALLVIFWASNRRKVTVNFFGFDTTSRVWVALAISGVIGFLLGLLVARSRRD